MFRALVLLIAICNAPFLNAQPRPNGKKALPPNKAIPARVSTAEELEARIRNLENELLIAKQELANLHSKKIPRIVTLDMEVGQTGIFYIPGDDKNGRRDIPLQVRIIEIIDETTKLVRIVVRENPKAGIEYIIKGESTKGLVTNKTLVLDYPLTVTTTEKYGEKTLFVLTPPKMTALEKTRWKYAKEFGSGYYEKQKDGTWIETGSDGKQVSIWTEKNKTAEYVELLDEKRGYLTRLGAGKAWLASTKDSKFNPSPNGDWEK